MKPDYRIAFELMMDYWDCIPDDEKCVLNERLRNEANI